MTPIDRLRDCMVPGVLLSPISQGTSLSDSAAILKIRFPSSARKHCPTACYIVHSILTQ